MEKRYKPGEFAKLVNRTYMQSVNDKTAKKISY